MSNCGWQSKLRIISRLTCNFLFCPFDIYLKIYFGDQLHTNLRDGGMLPITDDYLKHYITVEACKDVIELFFFEILS